jgi:hypothetical protein
MLHHVRTLARNGFLVREAERRGRRGAREIPYRATRKSWTLSFQPDATGHLAMIDASRAELAEAGPDSLLTLTRLGVRLTPERLEEIDRSIAELVARIHDADDPAGEPVSLLVALHRRP